MGKGKIVVAVLLLAAVSLQPQRAAAGSYVYTFLTLPGVDELFPTAINNAGEVTGSYYDNSESSVMAFTWLAGQFTLFGAPGGITSTKVTPSAINDKGTVAGSFDISPYNVRAFKRKPDGTEQKLPIHIANEEYVFASSINDSNRVVGTYLLKGSTLSHGYLYDNGVTTEIAPPNAISVSAVVINNLGHIAGSYVSSIDTQTHGFAYQNGTYTTFDPPNSLATDVLSINSGGVVTGRFIHLNSSGYGYGSGFVYANGSFTTYDHPGSPYTYIVAARSPAHFVGYYLVNTKHGGIYNSFNYASGKEHEILPPGSSSDDSINVVGINNQDAIVGMLYNGLTEGFVATCPAGQGACYR